MGSKKIIVPQGLINPNETTIIEIPPGVENEDTLVARPGPAYASTPKAHHGGTMRPYNMNVSPINNSGGRHYREVTAESECCGGKKSMRATMLDNSDSMGVFDSADMNDGLGDESSLGIMGCGFTASATSIGNCYSSSGQEYSGNDQSSTGFLRTHEMIVPDHGSSGLKRLRRVTSQIINANAGRTYVVNSPLDRPPRNLLNSPPSRGNPNTTYAKRPARAINNNTYVVQSPLDRPPQFNTPSHCANTTYARRPHGTSSRPNVDISGNLDNQLGEIEQIERRQINRDLEQFQSARRRLFEDTANMSHTV